MHRWLVFAAVSCVLTLAACSSNSATAHVGAEAKPSGSPSASTVPGSFTPEVGDCFFADLTNLAAADKVPCSGHHEVEETYIGTFSGAAAASISPPVANSSAMRDAYAQCAAPTRRYLGGDWHEALMELELTVPDTTSWRTGARWFRCELAGTAYVDSSTLTGADMSFRGVLAKSNPLSLRCITWSGKIDSSYNVAPKSCALPHKGEYVGVYTAPVGTWPSTAKSADAVGDRACEALVAHFVGFSSWDQMGNVALGEYWIGMTEHQWNIGDRSLRCFAAVHTKSGEFVGSLKGIGSRTPKG